MRLYNTFNILVQRTVRNVLNIVNEICFFIGKSVISLLHLVSFDAARAVGTQATRPHPARAAAKETTLYIDP